MIWDGVGLAIWAPEDPPYIARSSVFWKMGMVWDGRRLPQRPPIYSSVVGFLANGHDLGWGEISDLGPRRPSIYSSVLGFLKNGHDVGRA